MLFENICGNTCGWKSALKYVKCCLKTENGCLKTQTKHPLKGYYQHEKLISKLIYIICYDIFSQIKG